MEYIHAIMFGNCNVILLLHTALKTQLTKAARSDIKTASDNHWQPSGLTSCPYYSFSVDTNCSDRRQNFYKTRSNRDEISLRSAKKKMFIAMILMDHFTHSYAALI